MINAELGHCKTVEEFYKSIREQQEKAHGDDYCDQHDAIRKYAPDCLTYCELGVHQGGTLANALLAGFKYVEGIDIDLHRYEKFLKPLAEKHAHLNRIILKTKQVSSIDPVNSMGPFVDMMLIDSLHNPHHMAKELQIHSKRVKRYLVAHDTSVLHGKPNESLYDVLVGFCLDNPEWKIIERSTKNVGYTVLRNG